jgi:hypothetical protein
MSRDELALVTGGLLTESTVDDRVQAVETFISEQSIRNARAVLKRLTPYREWVRSQPRSAEAREMYKRIVRELGATIAGFRPDRVRVFIRNDHGASGWSSWTRLKTWRAR